MQMLVAMLVVADDANGGGDCEGRDQVELTNSRRRTACEAFAVA